LRVHTRRKAASRSGPLPSRRTPPRAPAGCRGGWPARVRRRGCGAPPRPRRSVRLAAAQPGPSPSLVAQVELPACVADEPGLVVGVRLDAQGVGRLAERGAEQAAQRHVSRQVATTPDLVDESRRSRVFPPRRARTAARRRVRRAAGHSHSREAGARLGRGDRQGPRQCLRRALLVFDQVRAPGPTGAVRRTCTAPPPRRTCPRR
jgi:hypothetical protein